MQITLYFCVFYILKLYFLLLDPDMCTGTNNCANVLYSTCNTTGLGTYECVCKEGYYALPGTLLNDNTADINYTTLLFPRQCEGIICLQKTIHQISYFF